MLNRRLFGALLLIITGVLFILNLPPLLIYIIKYTYLPEFWKVIIGILSTILLITGSITYYINQRQCLKIIRLGMVGGLIYLLFIIVDYGREAIEFFPLLIIQTFLLRIIMLFLYILTAIFFINTEKIFSS